MSTGVTLAPWARDRPHLDATVGADFARIASVHGQRDALVDVPTGRRLTYAELDAAANALACGLVARGIGAGDRVALCAPNCPEWAVAWLALARVGAVLVGVDPEAGRAGISYALRRSGARMVIGVPKLDRTDYCTIVDNIRPECPTLEWAVFIGSLGWDVLIEDGAALPVDALDAVAAGVSPSSRLCRHYTPGGVSQTLTHRDVLDGASLVPELFDYTPGDRICLPAPFHGRSGKVLGLLGALLTGACVVVPSRRFDPRATLRAVSSERCTLLLSEESQAERLLAVPGRGAYDLSSLRGGVVAGAGGTMENFRDINALIPNVICVP